LGIGPEIRRQAAAGLLSSLQLSVITQKKPGTKEKIQPAFSASQALLYRVPLSCRFA
jgi:hypothetical protein